MRFPIVYTILISSLLVCSNCKEDVPKMDPQDPRLPAYSEKGFSTSGVLINDTAWIGTTSRLASRVNPLEIHSYPNADSVLLILNGSYKDGLENLSPTNEIFIVLRNIHIKTGEDLKQLNGQKFTLDGQNQYGGFSFSRGSVKRGKATGFIQFGKVDRGNLQYGDGTPNNPIRYTYIVAGCFELSFATTRQFNLTKGRFDTIVARTNSRFTITE